MYCLCPFFFHISLLSGIGKLDGIVDNTSVFLFPTGILVFAIMPLFAIMYPLKKFYCVCPFLFHISLLSGIGKLDGIVDDTSVS